MHADFSPAVLITFVVFMLAAAVVAGLSAVATTPRSLTRQEPS